MTKADYQWYLDEMEGLKKQVNFIAKYEVPIYPFTIFYLIGKHDYDTINDLMLYYDRPKIISATHAAALSKWDGACYSRVESDFVINLPNIIVNPNEHSKLVHEAMHGIVCLFDMIGLSLSNEGQEAWCYFLDDIIEAYFKIQEYAIADYIKHPKLKGIQKYNHRP